MLLSKCGKRDSKIVVVVDRWSLAQVWLYLEKKILRYSQLADSYCFKVEAFLPCCSMYDGLLMGQKKSIAQPDF